MMNVFKTTYSIVFKDIPTEYATEYLKKLKSVNCIADKKIAIHVDINALENDERLILFNDGMFTPQFYHYWVKLNYEINKICLKKGYNSYWFDVPNNKYYDETVGTCLELMTDSLRWENNNPNTFYAWGNIDQKRIFKDTLTCSGLVMPCYEGWGIIALLNEEDYLILKDFFPA